MLSSTEQCESRSCAHMMISKRKEYSRLLFFLLILEKGGSEEPMVLYKRFRGADPDAGALLRGRGL